MQPNHFAFVRLLACFRNGPGILLLFLSFYCFKECFDGAPFTAASSPDSQKTQFTYIYEGILGVHKQSYIENFHLPARLLVPPFI